MALYKYGWQATEVFWIGLKVVKCVVRCSIPMAVASPHKSINVSVIYYTLSCI